MVIHDLDVRGSAIGPHEADAPLVVDPDRVLAGPVAAEPLEVVSRGKPEILENRRRVHRRQHGACPLHQVGRKALAVAIPNGVCRQPAPGVYDHAAHVS